MRRFVHLWLAGLVLLLAFTPLLHAKIDWLPVSPADLALKENPADPGSAAMILYREQHTDDINSFEDHYYRIKVFTDEGKKHADIEIPFASGLNVRDIEARTIRPDGSIVPFRGKIFDKVVVRLRGFRVNTKSFTLPEVEPGSIVEYRFTYRWDVRLLRPPRWHVQQELHTREVKFVLRPYQGRGIAWIWKLLPAGVVPEHAKRTGLVTLHTREVPALKRESHMPPDNVLRSRVEFFYTNRVVKDADDFWKQEGKEWHEVIENFIGRRRGIAQAAASLVEPADSDEAKLRKLYARVQGIRNLSWERIRSEREEKRQGLKDNNHVEDVWKNGHGYRNEINRLFVALARGLGMEAHAVRVSRRDEFFFEKSLYDADQLNGEISLVRTGGKDYYLDPGTPYCPFGALLWTRSGVQGLIPHKDGGTFLQTPLPMADSTRILRKAEFRLDEEGSLKGALQVIFTGQEALQQRLSARDEDEEGRNKQIEDEIKGWLPTAARIKITEITGWEESETPLVAMVDLEIPGYGASTGRRVLLPLSVFQGNDVHPFRHATRTHPVYFEYPMVYLDEVRITLPSELQVESLPPSRALNTQFGDYVHRREAAPGVLELNRRMNREGIFFRNEHYSILREFYDHVRTGDEEQAVLRSADTASR